LAELLVAAVEVADHRVHARYRLALEDQDGAEDAVGGRVRRPTFHGGALCPAVAQLDDFPGLGICHHDNPSRLFRRPLSPSAGASTSYALASPSAAARHTPPLSPPPYLSRPP